MEITFNRYTGTLLVNKYRSGQIRLDIVSERAGPIATCTVALEDTPPSPGCVWIKDYSENQGMLETLEKAGVVLRTGRTQSSGYVELYEAKLLATA